MPAPPALLLLELRSIALGIRVGDAMVKRAAVDRLQAGTVHPGNYLLLAAGSVGEVEEAWAAARAAAGDGLADEIFLPEVEPRVVAAAAGDRRSRRGEALAVLETATVPAILAAADAGVKGADVELLEVGLADGLGGKGYLLFAGLLADVQVAVETATGALERPDLLVGETVIPRIHDEMMAELEAGGRFFRGSGS